MPDAGVGPAVARDSAPSSQGPDAVAASDRRRRFHAMGTWVTVEAPAPLLARSTYLTMRTFERVEQLTGSEAGSALSKLQRGAGKGPQVVPAELWRLLSRARALGTLTGGAFDVSRAPLAELWDFGKRRVPDAPALKQALRHVDYRRLEVGHRGRSQVVTLPAGMRLGLGAVAKGWALDEAARAIRGAKVGSAALSAGGQVLVFGGKATSDGATASPWRVGIGDPLPGSQSVLSEDLASRRSHFAIVRLKSGNVATRGDYERFFERDGVRYHHLLDPHTGRPSRGLRSATVIDRLEATRAAALATALMVLGRERGLALIERSPQAEALLVDSAGKVHLSSGAKRWVTLLRAPRLSAAAVSPASRPSQRQQR